MFRYPKGAPAHSNTYYDNKYADFERGLVTSLPAIQDLPAMVQSNFIGTPWDHGSRLSLITQIARGGRFLDYGCSWGYFTYQARIAGYEAQGYEISRARAQFGRSHLGLDIMDQPAQLDRIPDETFDVIYSSHVLEHLTSLVDLFDVFGRLLIRDGKLVIFVPNCGGLRARRLGLTWGPFANEAHTLSLDCRFFQKNLRRHGFAVQCFSDPYPSLVADGHDAGNEVGLDGDELLVIATKVSRADAGTEGASAGFVS